MCGNADAVSSSHVGAHSLPGSWQLALRDDNACSFFDKHLVGAIVFRVHKSGGE